MLSTRSVPPDEWQALTVDLIAGERPRPPRFRATDWGQPKRLLASVVVWIHLTQSEYFFAPRMATCATKVRRDLYGQWRRFHGKRPYRHHISLKARLVTYMNELAHRIDGDGDLTARTPALSATATPTLPSPG